MESDINNNIQLQNSSPSQESPEITEEKNSSPETPENKEKKTEPKNEIDWKVHQIGLNEIGRPSIVIYSIKDWSISQSPTRIVISNEAFAHYVKQDAKHQIELDELKYIEERLQRERETEKESTSENLVQKQDPIKQIDIQRLHAA